MGEEKREDEELPAPIQTEDDAGAGATHPPVVAPSVMTVNMQGPDSFEIVQLIGQGDVGRVYLVRNRATGKPYAMKAMSKQEMIKRKKIQRCLTERDILVTANHPFIVTLYFSFQTSDHLFFIMDYCGGGEFFAALRRLPGRVKALPEKDVKFYAAEVLLGLEYLHMKDIIYRDLKPENILLHQSGHIMLTDFNLSKQAQTSAQAKVYRGLFDREDSSKIDIRPDLITNSFVGTEEYVAPEVISGAGHSSAVDWWTFGILLYEMLFGKTPFKGRNRDDTFNQILKCGLKLPDTPVVSREAKDLVKRLVTLNPKKRLGTQHGASDVKAHPFFNGVKWALLLNQTPPIRPQMDHPFDTRNFRKIKDDGTFIMTGNELSDEVIKTDAAFSQFTRGISAIFNFLPFTHVYSFKLLEILKA